VSLLAAARVIARLTWLRARRGPMVWVTVGLLSLPLAMLWVEQTFWQNATTSSWETLMAFLLRFPLPVAAGLHLAPAIGEEIDDKTYTYLWSRPIPRQAILYGKILAVAPRLALAFFACCAVSWLIIFGGNAGAHVDELVLGAAAVTGAVCAASALSVGVGALFPKHPFVFVLAYVVGGDNLLSIIPAVGKLSINYHAIGLALDGSQVGASSAINGAIGLVTLTAAWLAIGVWRVQASEYARADL
jgi:hypothetical protein